MQLLHQNKSLQFQQVLSKLERARSDLLQFRSGERRVIVRTVTSLQTEPVTEEDVSGEMCRLQGLMLWHMLPDWLNGLGHVVRQGHPATHGLDASEYFSYLPSLPQQPRDLHRYHYPVLVDSRRLDVAACCTLFGLDHMDSVTEQAFAASLQVAEVEWVYCHLHAQRWTDLHVPLSTLSGNGEGINMLTPLVGLFARHYYPWAISTMCLAPQLFCYSARQPTYFLLDGRRLKVVSIEQPFGIFSFPTRLF